MKNIIAFIFLGFLMVGCRGKSGKDGGNSGSTQIFTGVTNDSPFGVPVDNFGEMDTVDVYYSTTTDINRYFELSGPTDLSTTHPFYDMLFSGSNVFVRLNNISIGSHYRVVVTRSSSIY